MFVLHLKDKISDILWFFPIVHKSHEKPQKQQQWIDSTNKQFLWNQSLK